MGVNLGYIKMTLDTMRFQKMIGQQALHTGRFQAEHNLAKG